MRFFNIEIPEEIVAEAGLVGKYKLQEAIHSPGPNRPDEFKF